MKDNFIHVCFIIDESGSMYTSKQDVIGGFKRVIEEQRSIKEGKCAVSLYTFNNKIKEVYLFKEIESAEKNLVYEPGGGTALYDAVSIAIDNIGKKLSDMDESERPSKNLIVIMTDGEENYSKEYTLQDVKNRIKEQTDKYSWDFMYLGSDLTNCKDATDMGITRMSFSSKNDMKENYKMISCGVKSYRLSKNATEAAATMDCYFNEACENMTTKYETETGIKIKQ